MQFPLASGLRPRNKNQSAVSCNEQKVAWSALSKISSRIELLSVLFWLKAYDICDPLALLETSNQSIPAIRVFGMAAGVRSSARHCPSGSELTRKCPSGLCGPRPSRDPPPACSPRSHLLHLPDEAGSWSYSPKRPRRPQPFKKVCVRQVLGCAPQLVGFFLYLSLAALVKRQNQNTCRGTELGAGHQDRRSSDTCDSAISTAQPVKALKGSLAGGRFKRSSSGHGSGEAALVARFLKVPAGPSVSESCVWRVWHG